MDPATRIGLGARRTAWRAILAAGAIALAPLQGGCVSTTGVRSVDVAAVQRLPGARVATMVWTSAGLADSGPEVMLGAVGAALASAMAPDTGYASALNAKCLHAIEEVLRGEGSFQYLPREEARAAGDASQFFAQNQLAAALQVRAIYNVRPGLQKRLVLELTWTLVAPDGHPIAVLHTVSPSIEMAALPDKSDPRYEGLWIELARRGARDFLALLGASRLGPPAPPR